VSRPLGFIPRVARRDPGEAPIVAALRAAGCLVKQLSETDLPDLLVGLRGRFVLVEVKEPAGPKGGTSKKGQKLREGQRIFAMTCHALGLPVHVAHSPEEALRALGLLGDLDARFDLTDVEGGAE
jgi:hypothetical protein